MARVTHIPDKIQRDAPPLGEDVAHTYCGRLVPAGRCINMRATMSRELLRAGEEDCIDAATCKACQRSDDRRQVADYNRARREAKAAGKPFAEDQ